MSMINSLKDFFSSRFNTYLILALVAIGVLAFFITGEGASDPQPPSESELAVHFFYLPTCPHCTEQKPIYAAVKEERPNAQYFEHDASTQEGSQLFFQMARDAGIDTSRLGVPTIFVGERALVGVQTKEQLLAAIDECISTCEEPSYVGEQAQDVSTGFDDYELPFLGKTDLTKWSLPALAVVLGLIDGFNPCAMWVLVYLIGLLIGVKDKKRIWIIVGSFVLASGILYFLFMTAWINIFLLLGYIRVLTIIIGLVALGGGILSIKEYVTTKGAMVCKVTDVEDRKKTMSRIQRIVSEPLSFAIILSMIGLAFVINSVEFACSAAIPAVFTQILALSGISPLQHYLYIGLYTLFFMLDDLIIFGMAAFALGSGIGEKYAKYCRLVGGIIMTALGIIMVFAPHMLQ